jgi:hypothetical protein
VGTSVTQHVKARPMSFGGDLPGAGRLDNRECNVLVCSLQYDSEIVDRRMVGHCCMWVSIPKRWVARDSTLLLRFL